MYNLKIAYHSFKTHAGILDYVFVMGPTKGKRNAIDIMRSMDEDVSAVFRQYKPWGAVKVKILLPSTKLTTTLLEYRKAKHISIPFHGSDMIAVGTPKGETFKKWLIANLKRVYGDYMLKDIQIISRYPL